MCVLGFSPKWNVWKSFWKFHRTYLRYWLFLLTLAWCTILEDYFADDDDKKSGDWKWWSSYQYMGTKLIELKPINSLFRIPPSLHTYWNGWKIQLCVHRIVLNIRLTNKTKKLWQIKAICLFVLLCDISNFCCYCFTAAWATGFRDFHSGHGQ